ncbi:HupE/UreJ family protein [Novosphingobium sp. Gsoil 351]|uniref:HupE/UreJ family protein n=1 Tax=Novosphingobium sp. Gsoil 351 TaxID=2675225 RepID=UPI0018A86BEF|nr:HupE/UreJ family protein [Novosphingobium sp. Gsoil 351]
MLFALLAHPALAHLTPNSEIRLRFEPGVMRADVLIPEAEYRFATGRPANDLANLRGYIPAHTTATAPDGRRWAVALSELRVESAPGGPDIIATLTYTPPAGAPDRRLTLGWDAVIREADSHFALVSVSGDLAKGVGEGNDLLGSFTAGQRTLAIDRGAASHGALLLGAFRLGARHILEGHDHLLFLLALLLPAPLIAAGGRWGAVRPMRDTLRALAWIVTAFTIGHSTTLILAALFGARLPTAPVEAGIALSVLVSAIHAMHPLFPGRERFVAFGFGLVHGLAFATVISGFGATVLARGTAILGFNLGIEAVQLALVLLLLPALVVGSRTRYYRPARLALAGFTALAALAWLIERVSATPNAVAAAFAKVLPPLGVALVALSLAIAILTRFRLPVKPIERSGEA